MPLHDYRCTRCKRIEERFTPLARLNELQEHNCPDNQRIFTAPMERVFLQFPFSSVQADICYDSPVDGRAITTKHARQNDLARNECIPWEPGMRQDVERRRADEEKRFERSVEQTIDAEIAKLPARKRENLDAEAAGVSVDYLRA